MSSTIKPGATKEAIEAAASHWVAIFLWGHDDPNGCIDTPRTDEMERAKSYDAMLVQKMNELAATGIDPTKMTPEELLPGFDPSEIDLGYFSEDQNPPSKPEASNAPSRRNPLR